MQSTRNPIHNGMTLLTPLQESSARKARIARQAGIAGSARHARIAHFDYGDPVACERAPWQPAIVCAIEKRQRQLQKSSGSMEILTVIAEEF